MIIIINKLLFVNISLGNGLPLISILIDGKNRILRNLLIYNFDQMPENFGYLKTRGFLSEIKENIEYIFALK